MSHQPFPYNDIWEPVLRVIDAFGLDRCMWGTDWTRTIGMLTYEQGVAPFRDTKRLSENDKAALMGGTLQKVYKWQRDRTASAAPHAHDLGNRGKKDWHSWLRRDGYAQFPNLCPAPLVRAARAAIDQDLAKNFDPKRQVEYDHQSYCPALRRAPALMALLTEGGIAAKPDQAIGFDRLRYGVAQIALRRAGNAPRPSPPEPHIDGLPTPFNGVPANVLVSNFTVLVGVFLSPVRSEFAGNFTVWPGSHHRLERHFREHGLETLRNGMPDIPLGQPLQLMAEPGDVVLCHYQLAHAAAANLSTADRYAIYFRLWFKDIKQKRWELMTDIWQGWRI